MSRRYWSSGEGVSFSFPFFSLWPHCLVFVCVSVQMSVMHVLVRRHPSNTEPIKSKEELVFHCGFRRFRASPIFSQHTSGCQHSSNKTSEQTTAEFKLKGKMLLTCVMSQLIKRFFLPKSIRLFKAFTCCFQWFAGKLTRSITGNRRLLQRSNLQEFLKKLLESC